MLGDPRIERTERRIRTADDMIGSETSAFNGTNNAHAPKELFHTWITSQPVEIDNFKRQDMDRPAPGLRNTYEQRRLNKLSVSTESTCGSTCYIRSLAEPRQTRSCCV
jgi:hypothetical protein